jgi:hypothetical protein
MIRSDRVANPCEHVGYRICHLFLLRLLNAERGMRIADFVSAMASVLFRFKNSGCDLQIVAAA